MAMDIKTQNTTKKYRIAIRDALDAEMECDPKVVLMGQDIGRANGLYRLTEGLYKKYGEERVRDTPISETGTLGAAIGLAIKGFRPVVEIAFSDLMMCCFDPIVNQMAKIPYIFGTQGPKMPIVIRSLTGAGMGVGAHHSQSLEALFAHMPGLNVLMPGTAVDAAFLLRQAIRDSRPSIFLEHKMLLRDNGDMTNIESRPSIGQAEVVRHGKDITLVGYALTRKYCLNAAEHLHRTGINAEVVDLRTISPLDTDTVINSVSRTGRLLVVQEAYEPFGVGAEVLAKVGGAGFSFLKGPMERLAVPFVPIPAVKSLEAHYLPSEEKIILKVKQMLGVDA